MLNFEKPFENLNFKITDYIESNHYGRFEIEPLERGFGTTLGNALRRVMLSSMQGTAIIAVKIDGVDHEFQSLEGVVEDVTTIILNLKGVVLKNHSDSKDVKIAHITASKEGVVTAANIEVDSDIEVINKNQVIATLAKGGKIDMELIIANGRGYIPASDNKKVIENAKIGFIPMDALYSPIERISYEVETARVGQDANFDKLILNVNTDGSIEPNQAVALAANILTSHLRFFQELGELGNISGIMSTKQEDGKLKKLEISIDDLDLSVRSLNCLKKEGIETLGDLTEMSETEMSKIRNLGKKSLKEVIDKVEEMGLKFRDED